MQSLIGAINCIAIKRHTIKKQEKQRQTQVCVVRVNQEAVAEIVTGESVHGN